MSNRFDTASSPGSGSRSRAVVVTAALIGLEALALVIIVATLVIDLFTLRPDRYDSAIALTVLAAVAAVWMLAVTAAFWRGRQWSRAAALTWQVLQIAVAIGAFQGVFAQPTIGWALLAPALAVIVLLMTRSVIEHSRARDGGAS
ncbi:hypothetical protein [Paramicrobacterium agarici]|uniref:Uncharacterized protein n=1 Tax=Paramicrobacterium agarici TaxID=630514 RepID=A0A2A9DVQ1_9MICO|nr:hypothetical protein [Microbacterium agarici]PFG30867.1 hypothetical protein ATJ78_1809 [Microbacterium agarici]TQO23934.1 hypothetical protein FB385_2800 [Microbacterium agarici]